MNHGRARHTYLAVLLALCAAAALIWVVVRDKMMDDRIDGLEIHLFDGGQTATDCAARLSEYRSGPGLWRVAYYRGVDIRGTGPEIQKLVDPMWRAIGERGVNDLIRCVRGDRYVMWRLGIDNETTGGSSGVDNPGGARRGLSFGAAAGLAAIGKPAVEPHRGASHRRCHRAWGRHLCPKANRR